MGDSASEPELIDAGAEEEIRNALSLTKESRAWRIFKKLLTRQSRNHFVVFYDNT